MSKTRKSCDRNRTPKKSRRLFISDGWDTFDLFLLSLKAKNNAIWNLWFRNASCDFSAEKAARVRVGFWQNGFFADFYFWAAGFFRGFCRRIFSPHFCGKKCPEKSSRKIPGKILQNWYNKNPRHISAEGPGQQELRFAICDLKTKRFAMRFVFWDAKLDTLRSLLRS